MFEFRLLGHMEVRCDGALIEVRPRKLRQLLAVLVLAEGAVVSTDRIGGDLWESRPPRNAKNSIQVYVSQLRACLGDETHSTINRTDNGYRLPVDGVSVDVTNFRELVDQGLGHLRDGRHSFAFKCFDDALGMIRGEPLSDFAGLEFARPHVDYIGNLRRASVEGRLEARLALGSHQQVIAEARPLLRSDPYNEQIWAVLMIALYRSQRRTEALRSYQVALAELAEAGLEPSERLRQLESQIVAEDPSLLPTAQRPPSNLPDEAAPAGAVETTSRLVRDLGTESVVTLVGPPSSTRPAALDATRRALADHADGAWLVELGDLDGHERDGDHLAARAILDTLSIIPGPDPTATLTDYMVGRSLLVVLFDADRVVDEIARLATVMPTTSPNSRLMITVARAPDRAVGLVRAVARPAPIVGGRSEANLDRLLSRMQIFAGPVTLAALSSVVAFPPIEPEDTDYLLGRLLADERVLVDNSCIVARFGPAPLPPAERHGAEAELDRADLEETARRHGVYCHDLATRITTGLDGPGRRDLLNATKAEHDELQAAIVTALDHDQIELAIRIGHAAGRYWSSQGSYLGRAITVLGGLADRIIGPSTDAAGVHMGLGFAHFRIGSYDRSAHHYDLAVELARHEIYPALAGRAKAERGHLRMFLGDHVSARADLRDAGRLAQRAGSAVLQARTLMLTAQLGMRSPTTAGRPEQRRQLEDAIQIYERLGHTSGHANSLLVKASWHIDTGNPVAAAEDAERALQIAQLEDDRSMLAFSLVRSAESLWLTGDRATAHARAIEAVRVAVGIGNWLVAGSALLTTAMTAAPNPPDPVDRCLAAFVSIRRQLGVALSERELRWIETLDGGEGGPIGVSEAREIAYRLAR